MKCFVHHQSDAVGICKACQKGLCPECAVDLGYGLSCKGACEVKAAEYEKLVKRNLAFTGVQRRFRYAYAGFILLMGTVFTAWGVWYGQPLNFATFMGILFIAYGLVALRASLRWARDTKAAHAE